MTAYRLVERCGASLDANTQIADAKSVPLP
jgi:hypothetical protein